jgi:hypothetical protein
MALGAAAAVALVVVSLGVIRLATREEAGPSAGAGNAALPNPEPTLTPPERSIPQAPPAAAPPRGRPAVTTGVAHPAPNDPPPPLVLRPSRQTYDLMAGLGDLQGRVDRCAAGVPASALGDRSRTILWLEMETLAGKLRIIDAQVDKEGGASPELVACALGVLRGEELKMRVAKPGGRVRMQYPLTFAVRPPPAS